MWHDLLTGTPWLANVSRCERKVSRTQGQRGFPDRTPITVGFPSYSLHYFLMALGEDEGALPTRSFVVARSFLLVSAGFLVPWGEGESLAHRTKRLPALGASWSRISRAGATQMPAVSQWGEDSQA